MAKLLVLYYSSYGHVSRRWRTPAPKACAKPARKPW